MSNTLLIIIVGAICLFAGMGIMACFRGSGRCSIEEQAKQSGYSTGYQAGYLAGDRDGYRAGIRRMSVMKKERVDTAPGFDSVRTSCQGFLDSCKGDGK